MTRMTVKDLMTECGVNFGTSGARGTVAAMTDRVCYGYTQGFLSYMAEEGEFAPGGRVALAGDLRPSTPRILAEHTHLTNLIPPDRKIGKRGTVGDSDGDDGA